MSHTPNRYAVYVRAGGANQITTISGNDYDRVAEIAQSLARNAAPGVEYFTAIVDEVAA